MYTLVFYSAIVSILSLSLLVGTTVSIGFCCQRDLSAYDHVYFVTQATDVITKNSLQSGILLFEWFVMKIINLNFYPLYTGSP